jgi:hypothetical protein
VSVDKLAKQLRREIQASPKKAAVLGLLAVVGIYFWAPLVVGWCGGDKTGNLVAVPAAGAIASPTGTAVATSQPTASSNPVVVGSGTKPSEPPQHAWRKVVEWMEEDPRTKPAPPRAIQRDPFQTPKAEVVEAPKEVPKPVELEIVPQSLNIVLSGTIVGPSRRVARINGRTYEQGASIELAAKDGKSFSFTLAEVDSRRVVLERKGKQFELKLSTPIRSGRIELLGSVH